MKAAKHEERDFLIIGSGIAGMRAAIELARKGKVLVLAKDYPYESSTEYAQGGIAVALGDDDEVSLHLHDTLVAGDGLCREEAVKILVEEGPRLTSELIEWGTQFDRSGTKLAFTREGAHSRSRVLHAHGDSTGREILRALTAKASALANIEIRAFAFAVDLLVSGQTVQGVTYLDERTNILKTVYASRVLLATGGLGQVYQETTNPPVACGDGVAMAYRAGALLSDMEFVQFHPTALYVAGAPRFLLSEALRGEGAQLRNLELERFMPGYHEAAELAPRDIVSRAIITEMRKSRTEFVYLDLTGLDAEHVKKRFPKIYSTCLNYNVDITTDLVPVRPAAHYAMGGVYTDTGSRTSLQRLYAAGEVASNGVHGANRLASNSLLEGLVFGARAGLVMQHDSSHPCIPPRPNHAEARPFQDSPERQVGSAMRASNLGHHASRKLEEVEKQITETRQIMWQKVGIVRSGRELNEALERLKQITVPCRGSLCRREYELLNILQVAKIITRSALAREESRGAHYRSDFPLKAAEGVAKHSFISKSTPVYLA